MGYALPRTLETETLAVISTAHLPKSIAEQIAFAPTDANFGRLTGDSTDYGFTVRPYGSDPDG